MGRDGCSRHGGKALKGPAHPNWKGGASKSYLGKHLPHRLAERFEAALADPELLSLRPNLALSATRLGELLDKLSTTESGIAWKEMRACLVGLRTTVLNGDKGEAAQMVEHLADLVSQAVSEYQQWDDIREAQEHHRRLADTERKREDHLQAHVTAQQFTLFLAYFYRVINEEVSNPKEIVRIADKIKRVMSLGPANPEAYLPTEEVVIG